MSTILTSLHGRQAGIDRSGYLTSPVGAKFPALYIGVSESEALVDAGGLTTVTTASTGANISARGVTVLAATAGANLAYAIDAPVAGVPKRIFASGTSTGQTISSTGAAATFYSTGGSTHIGVTVPRGAALDLVGISTSAYAVIGNQGTAVFA